MNKNDCIIRLERKEDHREVENLIREAFWNVYRPGCLEHYVVHCLRKDPAFVPALSLVLEGEGRLLGHILFARAALAGPGGQAVVPQAECGPGLKAKAAVEGGVPLDAEGAHPQGGGFFKGMAQQ